MLGRHGLQRRSDFMAALRSFFLQQHYIEVDTPVRLPVLIPEAHIAAFSADGWWLQASPELCMKRLLARGCDKLFQICHCFRKEECGRLHQSEFCMLEWYRTESDYADLMADCEQLLLHLSHKLAHFPALQKPGVLQWQEKEFDLTPPWQRLSVHEAFRRYTGVEVEEALARDCYEELLVSHIEPHLGQKSPLFLYDYPIALGSLARTSPANPQVAKRFELYLAGIELANGFSELIDVAEQRRRFEEEIAALRAQGREAAMPERFLADLAYMPPAAGIALGVDRLFMLLGDYADIREAIPFPAETL